MDKTSDSDGARFPADRTPAVGAADVLLTGACLGVVLGCAALVLSFGQGRDQGIFNVVARTVLDGGMPYRDAWDFKTPGIYLVYVLARLLFGSAEWGIRVLEISGLLAMAAGLVALGQRWWGSWRTGLLAAALAALVHAQLDFWHTAQPETFGGMLTVAALWLGARSNPRPHHLVGSGLLFGAAGLLKPPLAGAALVLALWLGASAAGSEGKAVATAARRSLWAACWLLLGGVAVTAACLLWFALRGAMPALADTLLRFTPHYTALGWQGTSLARLLLDAAAQFLVGYSSVIGAGLLLAVGARRALRRAPAVGLLAGILAMQLVGVALQAKLFPYHFGACWPLAAMLAAWGWSRLFGWAGEHGRLATAAAVCALLASASLRPATGGELGSSFWQRTLSRARLLWGPPDQPASDALASVADVDANANRRMAAELRARVPVGGSVFVWGFEPVLYDWSDRRLASPFIYNVPQRVPWAAARARAELLEDLRAAPPDALVVVHGDPLPMVTGDEVDSANALLRFPELDAFVDEHYGRLKRIHDLDLYVRR